MKGEYIEEIFKTIDSYFPNMTDFNTYNIITDKGYYSDSEFVKLDT